ncbi:MAG: DUF2232 domain-containing protein [Gemmatimonadales bacterium]
MNEQARRADGPMSSALRFGVLALALLASPISPLLLVLIPLAMMLVALRADDVAALITGIVLLAVVFLAGGAAHDTEWFAFRSWPLLLGAGFVIATLLLHEANLFTRSLTAVATAFVAVAAVALLRPSVVAALDAWMAAQVDLASVVLLQWSQAAAASPDVAESVARAILRWAEIQRQVYPALLALASLPALAIGWYVLGRLTGRPEAPAPVREFRFNDHLVWLFAAGLALFVLAPGGPLERLGANAAVFMAALYVVRGGAVIGWVLRAAGATAWSWLLLFLATLLLYPVVLGAAFVFGVGDTWLNVRERFGRRAA